MRVARDLRQRGETCAIARESILRARATAAADACAPVRGRKLARAAEAATEVLQEFPNQAGP